MANGYYIPSVGYYPAQKKLYNPWQGLTTQQIRDLEAKKYVSGKSNVYPYGATGYEAYGTGARFQDQPYGTTGQATQPVAQPVYQPPAAQPRVAAGGGYSIPEFSVDLSGIWEQAGTMADYEINAQLGEIDRQLQQAGYTADESERAINEAYPVARRSLQKSIYENMVAGEQGLAAMGTGRGGGRQELLARAGEREATGLEAIETQKQRETGAIKRALQNYQGQLGSQKISLEGQRGGLRASYAEQLRGNRFNEASTIYNAKLNTANLAEQRRQFDESLANIYPATTGTAATSVPTGLSYFLTDADLAALGLGSASIPAKPKKYAGATQVRVRW